MRVCGACSRLLGPQLLQDKISTFYNDAVVVFMYAHISVCLCSALLWVCGLVRAWECGCVCVRGRLCYCQLLHTLFMYVFAHSYMLGHIQFD